MADTEGFELPETVKDVGLAIGSVVIVFLLTFAYSGNWPPMVAKESGSKEHDNNPLYPEPRYSHIGRTAGPLWPYFINEEFPIDITDN